MASATDSTTTATADAATDGQTSTSVGDSETGGGDTDGSVVEVDGVTISGARHSYECIDGCEGFYSSDRFSLTLAADEVHDIEVRWWGWFIEGEDWVVGDSPAKIETVHLEPGAPATIELVFDSSRVCPFEEWSLPLEIYIEADGSWLEVAGTSSATYGWDC